MIDYIVQWSTQHNQRLQLQHFYLVAAVVGIIAAGLVGLLNYNMGQRIVAFSLLALAVYVANAVVWTLLNALVIERFEREQAKRVAARKKPGSKTARKS